MYMHNLVTFHIVYISNKSFWFLITFNWKQSRKMISRVRNLALKMSQLAWLLEAFKPLQRLITIHKIREIMLILILNNKLYSGMSVILKQETSYFFGCKMKCLLWTRKYKRRSLSSILYWFKLKFVHLHLFCWLKGILAIWIYVFHKFKK